MDALFAFLPSGLKYNQEHQAVDRATLLQEIELRTTEEKEVLSGSIDEEEVTLLEREAMFGAKKEEGVVNEITKQEENVRGFNVYVKTNLEKRETRLRGQTLAKNLYHQQEFRCPEIIQQLSDDLEFAEETIRTYVTYFPFGSASVSEALRMLLQVLWPENVPEIQHLLLTHFSRWYLLINSQSLFIQPSLYKLSWAMILLNADLNRVNKGRTMTCKEFIANLNDACCEYQYPIKDLKKIYKSIKAKPLTAFIVKNSDSSFKTDNSPTTTMVHKTGHLVCKRVMDKHGRKTRMCLRSWKPFIAVLKGMVLHLQKDLCNVDSKHAIRLHHSLAYRVDHRKRPYVLCLRTTDYRLFYLQAESEGEQQSWITIINFIAARYSAPPLISASNSIRVHRPQVLPLIPTHMSLHDQLEYYKSSVKKLSGHIEYFKTLPIWDGALLLDYMEHDLERYKRYMTVLQEHVLENDAAGGSGKSNLYQEQQCAE